jgi:Na+-translocating ferredoxin:NAD+ oxidoreductase RnfG subunit
VNVALPKELELQVTINTICIALLAVTYSFIVEQVKDKETRKQAAVKKIVACQAKKKRQADHQARKKHDQENEGKYLACGK